MPSPYPSRTEDCLTAAALRTLFDPAARPDEAAFEHLKSCPRCNKLLGKFLGAGDTPVAELFPDAEISDAASRLEALVEGYLTACLEKPELLAKIKALTPKLEAADREYIGAFLDLLAESVSPARVAKLRELLEASASQTDEGGVAATDEEPRPKRAAAVPGEVFVFPIRVTRRAAGEDAVTVAEGDQELRGGWMCHIVYETGSMTSLRLDCKGQEPPVLELFPLSPDEEPTDFSRPEELPFTSLEDGCPVYYLDGDRCAAVGVPIVVGGKNAVDRFKVFTIGHYQ